MNRQRASFFVAGILTLLLTSAGGCAATPANQATGNSVWLMLLILFCGIPIAYALIRGRK